MPYLQIIRHTLISTYAHIQTQESLQQETIASVYIQLSCIRLDVVTTSGRKRYSLNDAVTKALLGLIKLTSIPCVPVIGGCEVMDNVDVEEDVPVVADVVPP